MEEQEREKKSVPARRWQVLIAILLLLLIYTLSGFYLLPWVLKNQAEKRLPELLQRPVTVAQIQFNPFTLQLKINDFIVKERHDHEVFVKIDDLLLDVAGFLSLSNRALVLERLDIQGPYCKMIRNRDLSYNFSDLLDMLKVPATDEKDPAADEGSAVHFSLNNIIVNQGLVVIDDSHRDTVHKIAEIVIHLPQISNLPNLVKADVRPSFSAVVNGTPLNVKGKTLPFYETLETHFTINLDKLNLPYYLSYLPGERNFVVAAGSLSTDLDMVYIQSEKSIPRLSLSGTATISDFLVSGKGDENNYRFISIPELVVTLGQGNLLAGEIFLDEIICHRPEINFLHKPDGAYYLPMLIAAASADGQNADGQSASGAVPAPKSEAEKKSATQITFRLGKMYLQEGLLTVLDRRVTPAFSRRLYPVDFKLENFTTVAGERAHYSLNLKSDLGESLAGSGEFALEPLEVKTHFDLQGLPLPKYAAYYRPFFAGKFAGGQLGLTGDVTVAKTEAGDILMQLEDLGCKLENCKLSTPDGTSVLSLPRFELSQGVIDFDKHECVIGLISGDQGHLNLIRRKNGNLNLVDLLPAETSKSEVQAPAQSQPVNDAWHLLLTRGNLQGCSVTFEDKVPFGGRTVFAGDQIDLRIDQFGTGRNETGKLDLKLRLAKRGKLSVQGAVGIEPLQAELEINLQKFPLPLLQNYLSEYLDLILVRGEFATKGHLRFRQGEARDDKLDFAGDLSLDNLKTVDNERAADIFDLQHLALSRFKYNAQPPSFSLEKALFKGLQVNFTKEGDGLTNLEKVMVKESPAVTNKADGQPETDIASDSALKLDLKELALDDSSIMFLDRSVSPAVEIFFDDLNGSVTGLTSLSEKPAEVKFSGRLNRQAPVSISGAVNPLGESLFADIEIKGEGLGLTSASPYSGKYIGHLISKGKVSFDLTYHIEDNQLKAHNSIFIDQFDFGSSVESSDAMNLPVRMAVSLLRNRQGEISLDLPVSGDLSDPEFSLGGIIIKVFINLITKAVTSPFALIGSLAGGGDDLNLVNFTEGRAELDKSAEEHLAKLAGVLYDRPGLKVEIVGRAEAGSDRQALQEAHFMKLLQTQKFKDMDTKNRPLVITDVVVEKDEFEKYLWQAYKAAPIEKEKILLLVKKIKPAEQERLLREFVKVDDDELLRLARQRAQVVMTFLTAKGPLEAKRLFLVTPQLLPAEAGAAGDKGRQVEIKIK